MKDLLLRTYIIVLIPGIGNHLYVLYRALYSRLIASIMLSYRDPLVDKIALSAVSHTKYVCTCVFDLMYDTNNVKDVLIVREERPHNL